MRGDPPKIAPPQDFQITSTPHARGSTLFLVLKGSLQLVYPACAGIHLEQVKYVKTLTGLPRMRGDPPLEDPYNLEDNESTPHARGSTLIRLAYWDGRYVYPACAGIHPVPSSST